jgi:hypothetical protein
MITAGPARGTAIELLGAVLHPLLTPLAFLGTDLAQFIELFWRQNFGQIGVHFGDEFTGTTEGITGNTAQLLGGPANNGTNLFFLLGREIELFRGAPAKQLDGAAAWLNGWWLGVMFAQAEARKSASDGTRQKDAADSEYDFEVGSHG